MRGNLYVFTFFPKYICATDLYLLYQFGFGARACIGRAFAWQEVWCVARLFSIELVPDTT
jgi:cytochrome P450